VIASELIPAYGPEGFRPLIVHTGDALDFGVDNAELNGHAFPMLFDMDDSTLDMYRLLGTDFVLFPLAYLIDREGVILHAYNEEAEGSTSPPNLIEHIEDALAE
jgi:hypothetical protein